MLETDSQTQDEQLARALLPYLEVFDEKAISALADRLSSHGIVVNAITKEANGGSILTFVKHTSHRTPNEERLPSMTNENNIGHPSSSNDSNPLLHRISEEIFWQQNANDQDGLDLISALCNFSNGTDSSMQMLSHLQQNSEDQVGIRLNSISQQTQVQNVRDSNFQVYPESDYTNLVSGCDDIPSTTASDYTVDGFDAYDSSNTTSAVQHTQVDRHPHRAKRRRKDSTKKQSYEQPLLNQELLAMRDSNRTPFKQSTLRELKIIFGRNTKCNLSDDVLLQVIDLSSTFIRPDLLEFFRNALPRWQNSGIWLQERLPEPFQEGTGHAKLFNAYICICKLEARLGDDLIRNRMALITLHSAYEQSCQEWRAWQGRKSHHQCKRGRGDASSVIDDILERLHDDWNDSHRKTQLRSRFHDKKRYGKRWLILTKVLGLSVVISCSSKVASVVQNTVYMAGFLEALAFCVRNFGANQPQILEVLNPVAESMMYLHGDLGRVLDSEKILNELRDLPYKFHGDEEEENCIR